MGVGQLSESDAVHALRLPFYSSSHPTGSHGWRNQFDLGNTRFNLLVLNGARDWISGNAPQHGDLDDHHIVPKSLGSEYALSTSIDTILTRTPLTSETNREVIRDRLPNEYLPELIATNGKDEVIRILESHFISTRAFDILIKNPFTPSDFEKFIEERGNTLRSRIEDLAGQVGL